MTSLTSENAIMAVANTSSYDRKPAGDFSEEYLAQRFARTTRAPSNIKYEFTTDAGDLHQYYNLREEMFTRVWGLKNFCGKKDAFDDSGFILVARQGLHCIGGGRLNISSPGQRCLLPMEKDDLRLTELFPELDLQDTSYGEFSRLAILQEFQASNVFPEIARRFIKKAIACGVEYAFNIAPVPLARRYQQAVQSFGLKWDICRNVAVPQRDEYEGIKMSISVMDLSLHVRNYAAASPEQKLRLVDSVTE